MSESDPLNEERLARIEDALGETTAARLRAEPAPGAPDNASLLRFQRDPDAMDPAERTAVERWLAMHPADRDALKAFRSLSAAARVHAAANREPGLFERFVDWLGPLTRSPALSTAAVLLVAGFAFWQVPLGGSEPRLRGDEEASVSFELSADKSTRISQAELPADGDVALRLQLPRGAMFRTPLATLERDERAAPPPEPLQVQGNHASTVVVIVSSRSLRRGDQRILLRARPDSRPAATYRFSVE